MKLLEWVTVPQAAKHLSASFGEEISEADIYQLALDKRMTLSVNLVNGAFARFGKIIPRGEARVVQGIDIPGADPYDVVLGLALPGDESVLEFGREVRSVSGVWDLPMIGSESLDVEHKFQQLTNGPEVTLQGLDGALIQRDGVICQLQEHFSGNEYFPNEKLNTPWGHPDNFYPAGGLPTDAVFVVRTGEIVRFQLELSEADSSQKKASNDLGGRAETTFLTIIGALVELVRTPRPGRDSDAAVIRELIDNYSDKPGISKTTLEAKFAEARRRLSAN